jgi:hypothetical protein
MLTRKSIVRNVSLTDDIPILTRHSATVMTIQGQLLYSIAVLELTLNSSFAAHRRQSTHSTSHEILEDLVSCLASLALVMTKVGNLGGIMCVERVGGVASFCVGPATALHRERRGWHSGQTLRGACSQHCAGRRGQRCHGGWTMDDREAVVEGFDDRGEVLLEVELR